MTKLTHVDRMNRRQALQASRGVAETDPVAFAVVLSVALGTALLAGIMSGEMLR